MVTIKNLKNHDLLQNWFFPTSLSVAEIGASSPEQDVLNSLWTLSSFVKYNISLVILILTCRLWITFAKLWIKVWKRTCFLWVGRNTSLSLEHLDSNQPFLLAAMFYVVLIWHTFIKWLSTVMTSFYIIYPRPWYWYHVWQAERRV